MSSSKPKRPSFVRWLRVSGQITEGEYVKLAMEWNQIRKDAHRHQVYTTAPTTWDQFVASKYPQKALAYQAYLRLIGATPISLKKD